ncbi:MAG TPA: FtsX-like permease family protein, partial [Vicinamibacterales bacterium]|nr:FtsX-like permease family protein [Vicinamibacterales bacterium]
RAIADVQAAASRASVAYPATNHDTSATVAPFADERGGTLRSAMALLAGASGFVLIIACANLAGLQLARSLARAREFGIRTALGASRSRLVRQLMIESLVLASLGSAAGLAVSSLTLRGLAAVAPAAIRGGAAAALDAATVAWAAVLALVSVSLFAVAPAWRAAQQASRWINQRAATGDRRTSVARTVLVTGQLALAVMLLVSATLLVVSLSRVLRVDPGFNADGVLAFDLTLPFQFDERQQLLTDVLREVKTLPGVAGTCVINVIPFDETFNMTYVPDGQTAAVGAFPRTVTPGCFDVLGLRLKAGRLFTDREPARVGIVTDAFARRAWKGASAIGQRVHVGVADGAVIEIVGVVADSLQQSLDGSAYPQFYEVVSPQAAFPASSVLVRTVPPPVSLFNAVRAAVRRVDPNQPVGRLRALEDIVGASAAERKFDLGLLGGFAAIALILSAVGIYGLFAHVVAERRSEIGIRMALGAVPGAVVRLMLRRAWLAIGLGLAAGLAGAFLVSGTLRHLLFELSPTDPRIYAGTAIVLGLIALTAAWIPSRRAARVDPVHVLRDA